MKDFWHTRSRTNQARRIQANASQYKCPARRGGDAGVYQEEGGDGGVHAGHLEAGHGVGGDAEACAAVAGDGGASQAQGRQLWDQRVRELGALPEAGDNGRNLRFLRKKAGRSNGTG